MIILKLNEDKRLMFSYGVSNVHPEDITGNLVLDFGDVNIGFPIKIHDKKIVAEVKSLGRFLSKPVGVVVARLEIVASDTFLIPWTGEVRIDGPVEMTVKQYMIKPEVQVEKRVDKDINPIEKQIIEQKKLLKQEDEPEVTETIHNNMNNLRRLLSLKEEDMKDKVKDEKIKEKEEIFSDFLNTPIEELM